jgi:hypothetical protein
VFANQWPKLQGRLSYVEDSIETAEVDAECLIVSIHACGVLSDQVLDRAIEARARVAIMPCCHDLKRCDTGKLEGWLDGPTAVDVRRAERLEAAGYDIHTTTIPDSITPKNRVLMGCPRMT